MQKHRSTRSAFFNFRVLFGVLIVLASLFLALVGLDAFATNAASVKVRNHIIAASNDSLVPVQKLRNWASTSKRTCAQERS
jgi:hypothetical protein